MCSSPAPVQFPDNHQLVAPVVNHLNGDAPVAPSLEGGACGPGEMVPNTLLKVALERLLETVPSAGARKERLRDVEALLVVIRIEEPGRHVIPPAVDQFHCRRVEYVKTE